MDVRVACAEMKSAERGARGAACVAGGADCAASRRGQLCGSSVPAAGARPKGVLWQEEMAAPPVTVNLHQVHD